MGEGRSCCRPPALSHGRGPVALDPYPALAAGIVHVADHAIDHGGKLSADFHHQPPRREFVRAQAHLLVPGRNMLPTEGFQVGAVYPIGAAMIWIKGAHAAPSPRVLAPFRVTVVAPGI